MPDILATDFIAPNKTFIGPSTKRQESFALSMGIAYGYGGGRARFFFLSADRGFSILRDLVASLRDLSQKFKNGAFV